MDWLAQIIQKPAIVPHILPVFFSSKHGTSKSGFAKFLAKVFGNDLSYFGSFDQIMEKHTSAHVGKLLNIIEEVDRYTSRKYHQRMKDCSQREIAVHNEKNKPQYQIRTYVRYIQLTNNYDGAFFDDEDRRHVVFTFDKVDDEKYVKKLLDVLADNSVACLFGEFLSNWKITVKHFTDWEKQRPLTKDYYNMILQNQLQ